ncbi:MAG: acyl-CoA dehydrogenase [Gammaproteobacteria bacterium]|nr:acyl-CoA dehydrogenase [Gammaproteobacteria bacterium]
MLILGEIFIAIFIFLFLIFYNVPLLISTVVFLVYGVALTLIHGLTLTLGIIWALSLVIMVMLNFPPLRRHSITSRIFLEVKNKLPRISKTEREVLAAGDVWWEKELFIGRPNWKQFLKFPVAKLSKEESDFLNNQVNILCHLLDDWGLIKRGDLSPEAWDYIKKERFLGLTIPKKYGGRGFSAFAHSTIIMKIASRSYSAAVNIMVPNSVGLAEFILEYGTPDQKSYYLPRFVVGEEIPCFALTSPGAGSDAGSMTDEGIVCHQEFNGQNTLGIRLNWNKRYITLAPMATMIGLAFKLFDPDHLLGGKENIGITLAMIPRNFPGVTMGNRHSPLLLAFLNGPVSGKDVFIPLEYIIGGVEARGKGWWMLMEGLSVGRGLSLPALSCASAKLAYRMTGAYAKIREQFNTSIGTFEGVKEALARIGAFTYMAEATRFLTASAIDQEAKPSIATAITKYHLTELSRKIINDAMDIHGGRSIQLGPNNYLGIYYIAQPISITVEGANILTRNLIIFGQGVLRCHPFIQKEVAALQNENTERALNKFDKVFFKHIGYGLSNLLRGLFYGLTNARFIRVPIHDYTSKFYRQLTRMSVALAIVTDISLATLGGELKQKERLSARLGDVLSYLYLASATLKYYEDHQKSPADLPFIEWIQNYCLYQMANAFNHFFVNFPKPFLARLIKNLIFPWGNNYHLPLDVQDHQIANTMMQADELRERLTENMYLGEAEDICRKMDKAFECRLAAEPSYQKLQSAIKNGVVKEKNYDAQIVAAKNANILTDLEVNQLRELEQLRFGVIQVDEFNSLMRNEEHGRKEVIS